MKIIIPESFKRAPFYHNHDTLEIESTTFFDYVTKYLFIYELMQDRKPWQEKQQFLPLAFSCWKEQEKSLVNLYKERNIIAAKQPMIHMIALFINALFWANNQPVTTLKNLEETSDLLRYKPVNVSERLTFLLEKPERYHSFVQLRALMTELEKLYARIVVVEKH